MVMEIVEGRLTTFRPRASFTPPRRVELSFVSSLWPPRGALDYSG